MEVMPRWEAMSPSGKGGCSSCAQGPPATLSVVAPNLARPSAPLRLGSEQVQTNWVDRWVSFLRFLADYTTLSKLGDFARAKLVKLASQWVGRAQALKVTASSMGWEAFGVLRLRAHCRLACGGAPCKFVEKALF